MMSTRGYGIFFHTPFTSTWDLGHESTNTYSFEAEGGELDYYFIYGPDFPAILDGYTDLTGKAPLLPKAALGLHVGTYSGGTWGHGGARGGRCAREGALERRRAQRRRPVQDPPPQERRAEPEKAG